MSFCTLFACSLFLVCAMSCRTQPREASRPVLLLLEGSESEWDSLPAEIRNAFAEHVRIETTSVDEIVNRPDVLNAAIGFLCATPSALEPIRYLSLDPIDTANPDIPLHLFRRRTPREKEAEQLRPLFTHLESLSPRMGWEPPPSQEEMQRFRLEETQLEKILTDTPIGNFKPLSHGLQDLCHAMEAIAREAGANFDHPIFVVLEQERDRLRTNGPYPNQQHFNLTPDTTLLNALRRVTEAYDMFYSIDKGQVIVARSGEETPKTWGSFRINPERLRAFKELNRDIPHLLPLSGGGAIHFEPPDTLRVTAYSPDMSAVMEYLYLIHTTGSTGKEKCP